MSADSQSELNTRPQSLPNQILDNYIIVVFAKWLSVMEWHNIHPFIYPHFFQFIQELVGYL